MLTTKQVNKFREVYQKQHGQEIDYDTANEKAICLLNLVRNIYKPIPKELD